MSHRYRIVTLKLFVLKTYGYSSQVMSVNVLSQNYHFTMGEAIKGMKNKGNH